MTYPAGYDIGLENEPWLVGESGALYAVASSWDVFQRTGKGSEHTGPEVALVRRVDLGSGTSSGDIHAATLGPVFWLADTVPRGFELYCNTTFRDAAKIGAAAMRDLTRLRARLVSTEPSNDASKPNERSVYALPMSSTPSPFTLDLVLLLRSGGDHTPQMWASTSRCEPSGAVSRERAHPWMPGEPCRPGTGLFNKALLPEVGSGEAVSKDDVPSPMGAAWKCLPWSDPVMTNIPDSHSRTCAATLADGRTWLVGAMLPKTGDRTPLTLALSEDGLAWSKVWSLRDSPPPKRYHGYPGFQYPAGMPSMDGRRLLVTYSINKEDIAVTSVPLANL